MWYYVETDEQLAHAIETFGTNYDMYVGWTQQMVSSCGAARYLPASINRYMAAYYSV